MKVRKSRPKQVGSLNQRLERRLISYAAAATAGAGVFGFAQPAEAQIVYTPAHVYIGVHSPYALDLTNTGTTDFGIGGRGLVIVYPSDAGWSSRLQVAPALGNAVESTGHPSTWGGWAPVVGAGQRIGSSQHFTSRGFISYGGGHVNIGMAGKLFLTFTHGFGNMGGPWLNVNNGYLGLSPVYHYSSRSGGFQINGETHSGWARMTVEVQSGNDTPPRAFLTGYAYETQPNTPIIAGGTVPGEDDAAPIEPKTKEEPGPAPHWRLRRGRNPHRSGFWPWAHRARRCGGPDRQSTPHLEGMD